MTINADNTDEPDAMAADEGPETVDSSEEMGSATDTASDAAAGVDADFSTDETDLGVDTLIAAGKYERAARAAARAGDHARAASLYERIWEFSSAAHCALLAGDLPRALANAIEARDDDRVRALAEELASDPEGGRQAVTIFADKRRFAEAGELAESLGERERAVEYFLSAHRELDAARLLDSLGRDREAGRVLERFLELSPPGEDKARAHLALGTILERRMNHESAARHLQEAARHPATQERARRSLVMALAAMGLRDAARDVLVSARADDDGLTLDIDEFVREERERMRGEERDRGDEGEERIIGGRYRLLEVIGAGGAGRVFEARDEVNGRSCAVKIFHAPARRGDQSYERFVREAKLASTLRHPNLVEVLDFSADQGYMVMELMTGSLEEKLAHGAMLARPVQRMVVDLLGGLELAHQRGVIHRDIKPANIFFDARGTAKLGDFGVAHLLDLGQTQTGGLIGTLAYMAPEQITGARLTITADLYALGITLFRALTGRLPFLGPDFVAQHLGEPAPPPSHVSADVAPAWDEIAMRLLAKNPGERYTAIEEVRNDLLALELGEDNRTTVLVLPRASGRDAATQDAGVQASAMRLGAMGGTLVDDPEAEDAAEQARYQFETGLGKTEYSRISRAVDTVLERSVIIERYRNAEMDPATERRFLALARGGGPFLQRALSYERGARVAVFEAPSGAPIGEVFSDRKPSLRGAARLLKRLARALAPLHETSNAHGALGPNTILVDDELNPTVLVCGLGPADADATPPDDVRRVLELVFDALDAPVEGDSASAHLARVLLPDVDADARERIARIPTPRTGEELYALVDAIEISLLRTQQART